ncbi:tRNA adenosine(34) deaminase TadA [Buchnera aphidicola]|uniref:tRNA adenosine(34) deaminase TadA n=1 Tax=Buchnera aphidicola TaxID=9 RepID=UPI0031B87907
MKKNFFSSTVSSKDKIWMQLALILANKAKCINEVPVGAILIFENRIIGSGFNCSIANHDPTAHAEIIAIQEGGKILKNYRLNHTTLYVTLQPCIMCLGAIINSRISRLVIGTKFLKKKKDLYNTSEILQVLKTKIEFSDSISLTSCTNIIKKFFQSKRL